MSTTDMNSLPQNLRSERLEARVSKEQKTLFQRAAALQGWSLTDFLIASAQETAMKIVREHETLQLSEQDRKVFVEALLNPPKPGKPLRKAARRYKERMGL